MDLLYWHGNSFSSSLSPLMTMSRIYSSLVYLYQFLLKYLRLPPWTFCTSSCSSFTITLLNPGGLTIFNFSFVYGGCCCCCDCCCKVYGIDQSDSFDTHFECDFQGFEGINISFLKLCEEVLYGFDGILNNFLLVVTFIILLGKSSPKKNSDSGYILP